MHLEGKLHTGYLKIRKVLSELKQKREEYRRMSEKSGRKRSRSRSQSPNSKNPNRGGKNENAYLFEDYFNYSSKRLGTGAHCPETTTVSFSEMAINANNQEG